MRKIVEVLNERGVHARPASILASEGNKFRCDIYFQNEMGKFNGKSIMNLMSLGLVKGDKIEVITEGEDSKEAMTKICSLFEEKFGE